MTARRRIALIEGHPDPAGSHLCHALADSYAKGAEAAGHEVRRIKIAALDFPLLRTKEDFDTGTVPEGLKTAQETIREADHLVILYPLWLGSMPALLKGFLEQILRPGFGAEATDGSSFPKKLLKGKSARIVVTMGMPAFVYRWYYCAHSLKSLERNILAYCGIAPIRETLLGLVENASPAKRQGWLDRMRALGAAAA